MEVAGIEPDTPCAESPVSIKDSDFSPEALIKILTNLTDADRQMLTQIVERWGSLSEELKSAVLRVVDRLSGLDSTNFKNASDILTALMIWV